jgi:hypothetical protein
MGKIEFYPSFTPTPSMGAEDRGKHMNLLRNLERETRLELATSTLARLRSTN